MHQNVGDMVPIDVAVHPDHGGRSATVDQTLIENMVHHLEGAISGRDHSTAASAWYRRVKTADGEQPQNLRKQSYGTASACLPAGVHKEMQQACFMLCSTVARCRAVLT